MFLTFDGQVCSFSSEVKDNLLVAQIFRHGDNLRSIKKFILIIFITHVSFARAAVFYKEKNAVHVFGLYLPSTQHSRILIRTTDIATNGRKPWKKLKK